MNEAEQFGFVAEKQDTNSSSQTEKTRPNKGFGFFGYATVALIVLAFISTNWIYQYHRVSTSVGFSSTWMLAPELDGFSMAGWPLKYYISSASSNSNLSSAISLTSLIGNTCAWGSILACYIVLRKIRIRNSATGRRLTLRIADVLWFMLVVALVLFYIQMLHRRAATHRAIAQKIKNQGGFCSITSFLPTPLKPLAGIGLEKLCERISVIQISHPSNQQITESLALPHLQGLYLQGGEYNLRLLDQVPSKPLLRSLGVGGRKLDSQFIAVLSQAKQLSVLCLPRTNITRQGLDSLGDMPRLKSVGLMHTDVQLDSETAPPWAKNVAEIQLPRPPAGQSCKHILDGWTKLVSIECLGGAEARNDTATGLTLKNLPSLQKIKLDVLQVFDLTLDHIPESVD